MFLNGLLLRVQNLWYLLFFIWVSETDLWHMFWCVKFVVHVVSANFWQTRQTQAACISILFCLTSMSLMLNLTGLAIVWWLCCRLFSILVSILGENRCWRMAEALFLLWWTWALQFIFFYRRYNLSSPEDGDFIYPFIYFYVTVSFLNLSFVWVYLDLSSLE